jgi:hypothetical protein
MTSRQCMTLNVIFDYTLGLGAPTSVPENLIETLLTACGDDAEPTRFVTRMSQFAVVNKKRLAEISREHSSGAPDYVEARDWLYRCSEYLLIAELAVSAPYKIRHAIAGSDYETVIEPMIAVVRGEQAWRAKAWKFA